jgi:cytochrome c oxidase assembly protein subunit 15
MIGHGPRRAKPPELIGGLSKYEWLVLATCLTTYALIIVGGIVRTTGSGDACPDWPRCHGTLLPPFQAHVLIEFSHRLLASLIGVLVAAIAVAGWRSRREAVLRWGGILAVGLVVAQILLGGATVLSDLSANIVMAHLALASTLLATLLVLALVAIVPRYGARRDSTTGVRNLAALGALAVFIVMMTGSYVSGSGAGLAFRDWPLFDGSLMPHGGRLAMIHATHRFAVLLLGVLLAYLALRAWRSRFDNGILTYGPLFAFALYLVQALVGAANIWTLLQPSAAAAHLALAIALWGTMVTITTVAHLTSPATGRVSLPQLEKAAPQQVRTPAAAGEPS